jgi:diguanylate cyclase (GGDEF)-like protein
MPQSDAAVFKDSLFARVLAQGFGRLKFPEPLESEFRRDWEDNAVRWVRLCLYVAIVTSIGFSLIDHWVIRASNAIPDLVRYGLQLPVLLICVGATLWPAFRRWYPLAIQIGGPLYGLGTVLLVAYAQSHHTALIGSRLLLVCFFVFFMCGLRVAQSLRTNLLILGWLVIAGVIGLIPAEIATYLSFAYVVGIIIGTAGSYALEHATRTSFLERRLLREMAELDGLTRLLNRQTFETRAREGWRRASEQRQPVTVIMIDVDNFKLYNDHYGHQAGDDCLTRVAAAVRAAVGHHGGDLVARYGGEEMIALLTGHGGESARDIAQRIVGQVAAMAIPHAASLECQYVSVSVGAVTQLPPLVSSYDAIVRQADSALYSAKHQGRNRCVTLDAQAAA